MREKIRFLYFVILVLAFFLPNLKTQSPRWAGIHTFGGGIGERFL